MSNVKRKRSVDTVKCTYCGRENVIVTKKGYMNPHIKPDGRPCLMILIPNRRAVR